MGVAGLDCGRWIWHILDQRENDETLPKHPDDGVMHYDAGYWGVQANDYAVRHVRIVQVAAKCKWQQGSFLWWVRIVRGAARTLMLPV